MHGSALPTLRDLARSALLEQLERTPEPAHLVTRSQCLERAVERAGRESFADLAAFRAMLRAELGLCSHAAELYAVDRELTEQLELVDTAGWRGRVAWQVALELVHDESIVYGVVARLRGAAEHALPSDDEGLRLIRRRCRALAAARRAA